MSVRYSVYEGDVIDNDNRVLNNSSHLHRSPRRHISRPLQFVEDLKLTNVANPAEIKFSVDFFVGISWEPIHIIVLVFVFFEPSTKAHASYPQDIVEWLYGCGGFWFRRRVRESRHSVHGLDAVLECGCLVALLE